GNDSPRRVTHGSPLEVESSDDALERGRYGLIGSGDEAFRIEAAVAGPGVELARSESERGVRAAPQPPIGNVVRGRDLAELQEVAVHVELVDIPSAQRGRWRFGQIGRIEFLWEVVRTA